MSAPESITPSGSDKVECSICASVIGEPRDDGSVESGAYLPCGHFFGMRCLAHNITERQNCPMCRTALPRDIITDLLRINRGLQGSATGDRPAEGGQSWRELDMAEGARDAATVIRPGRAARMDHDILTRFSSRRGYRPPESGGSLTDQFRTRRQQRAESTAREFQEGRRSIARQDGQPHASLIRGLVPALPSTHSIRAPDRLQERIERLRERVATYPSSLSSNSSADEDFRTRRDIRTRYNPSSSSHLAPDSYNQYSPRAARAGLDHSPSPPSARHHTRSYRNARPDITNTARGTIIEEVTRDLRSLSVRDREQIFLARRRARQEEDNPGVDNAGNETLERALNDPDYFRREDRYLNRGDSYSRDY